MKEIKLKIDDRAYEAIRQHMMVKESVDSIAGIEDAFVFLIIKSIEENKKEVEVKLKEK